MFLLGWIYPGCKVVLWQLWSVCISQRTTTETTRSNEAVQCGSPHGAHCSRHSRTTPIIQQGWWRQTTSEDGQKLTLQEATTVARCLIDEFFSRFGVPFEIHSDKGRSFESRLFQEMCKLLQTRKTRTTPLHPLSDGMVERMNTASQVRVRVPNRLGQLYTVADDVLPQCSS